MALPSSGTISLSMIAAEFGGSAPHSLSEYYRGGAYVPNHAGTASIPTSGQIAFSHFYGAYAYIAPSVDMPNVYDYKQGTFGGLQGGITLNSNGSFAAIGGEGAGPNSGSWLTAGSASDVQVYASKSGGAGASWSGVWDTWVDIGDMWTLTRSNNGTSTGTINLTFRNKTTLATLDTAFVDIEVYRGTPV